jgi:hypothetical protein
MPSASLSILPDWLLTAACLGAPDFALFMGVK